MRAKIINPDIRIGLPNDQIHIRTLTASDFCDEGEWSMHSLSIPHGDYSYEELIEQINQLFIGADINVAIRLNSDLEEKDDQMKQVHERLVEFYIPEKHDEYIEFDILNTQESWKSILHSTTINGDQYRDKYWRTITRTLGFGAMQRIYLKVDPVMISREDLQCMALFQPRNLYIQGVMNKKDAYDTVTELQCNYWTPHIRNFQFELNREINIGINNLDGASTATNKEMRQHRYIAKVTLGAPGMPSKRLISTEVGIRKLYNPVQITYNYEDGDAISDKNFNANIDCLILYK